MSHFKDQLFGPVVSLRARNSAIPNTFANMNAFNTSTVNWKSVFDKGYTLDISSSSTDDVNETGTGAWTADVYGLDNDFNPIFETIELNGHTVVTTTKEFRRVFEIVVMSAGTGGITVGDLYVIKHGTGGTYTNGVPGTLTGAAIKAFAGDNFGLSGIWTAPRGTVYTLRAISVTARGQSGTLKFMQGYPAGSGLSYPRRKIEFTPGMPVTLEVNAPVIVVNEKEDVYFLVLNATAGGLASVEATFVQQGVTV